MTLVTVLDNGEVACVATTVAKPGFEGKVRAALEALLEPVRAEKGVLQYDLHIDVNNDRRFMYVERWENLDDFNAHCIAPHINDYLVLTDGWLEDKEAVVLQRIG